MEAARLAWLARRAGSFAILLVAAFAAQPQASVGAVAEEATFSHARTAVLASATRTFLPVADSSVSVRRPGTSVGRDRILTVEGVPVGRAYLRFQLRGLTGRVVQARLRLFAVAGSGKFELHGIGRRGWSDRSITYANAPRLTGRLGYAEARTGWTEFDVTGLVSGNGMLGVALTRISPQKLQFASREAGVRAPRLVVESEPASAPVVAAAGDIGCSASDAKYLNGVGTARHCRMRATSDLALRLRPDLVLALGDNLNSPGTYDEFVKSFHPTWGRLKNRLRPVPGNWEYADTGAEGYYRYFGSAAGDPQKGYYSLDLGAWHLVALNSNCGPVGGCHSGSPQEQWLRADLAASSKRCTLAYVHVPRFTTGNGGEYRKMDALWRALADGGVELLVSGQKHAYERMAELNANGDAAPGRGVRQFIAGTGGHSHGGNLPARSLSEARDAQTFGILRLALRPGSYEWRFVPVVGGTFTDRGSSSCH